MILMTPDQLEGVLFKALEKFQATRPEAKRELPENINIDQAVELLRENGYPTAKTQIYKFTSAGEIPYRKYGSVLVFSRAELLKWAESRTKNHTAGHGDTVLSVARNARKHQR